MSKIDNPYHVRGWKFELKCIRWLKELGYKKLGRTILVNKELDNKGVDVQAKTDGKPELNIQCKATSKLTGYHTTLTNMPKDGVTNVLLHEYWFGGQIAGHYAILTQEDFFRLVNR